MTTRVDVRVEVSAAAVRDLAHEEWLGEMLLRVVDRQLVPAARRLAPRRRRGRSEGGAQSIGSKAGHDEQGQYVDVSWDREHEYMRFPDKGTRYVRGEHFLENAVRQAERT
jgi:HK97 gp10 family phage protein